MYLKPKLLLSKQKSVALNVAEVKRRLSRSITGIDWFVRHWKYVAAVCKEQKRSEGDKCSVCMCGFDKGSLLPFL